MGGDQITEAGLRRHQLGGDDRGPAGAEGGSQADHDAGHRRGQDDLAEQRGFVPAAGNRAAFEAHGKVPQDTLDKLDWPILP